MKNPHPNIVNCLEIIEDDLNVYIVEELLPQGDLLQYLTKHAPLKEAEVKKIFWTVLSAVQHLHSLHIVHRDVKLENLLFDARGKIKLIDFNLSSFYSEKSLLTRYCGSLPYCPPEMVLRTPYIGPEVDVWSLGVLLYLLLFVRYPFPVDDERDIECLRRFMTNLLGARYFVPTYHPFSNEAISLLRSIFCVDRHKRICLQEVMDHPWLQSVREESNRRKKAKLFAEQEASIERIERKFTSVTLQSECCEVKSVIQEEENVYHYEEATHVSEPSGPYVAFRPFLKNGIVA
jgi:serine/threonine protein kinase